MKYKKWNKLDKSKRSSYSPVVFKHDCSLETWSSGGKKAIPEHLHFSNNFKIILICIWVFKKWLQVFLLDPSFGDLEFYYFYVDQLWLNGIKWVIVT